MGSNWLGSSTARANILAHWPGRRPSLSSVVICVNEAAFGKLAPALPSFPDHKTLGKLVGGTAGHITIATSFGLAKRLG